MAKAAIRKLKERRRWKSILLAEYGELYLAVEGLPHPLLPIKRRTARRCRRWLRVMALAAAGKLNTESSPFNRRCRKILNQMIRNLKIAGRETPIGSQR